MTQRIVLSGVNLVDFGPLSIFRDALASLASTHHGKWEIVALVHSKELFDIPGVVYLEYPTIKRSWIRRLKFEYWDCYSLSKKLKPSIWIAMHDITPRVQCRSRFVYCHNPAPFYKISVRECIIDPKFGAFTILYRLLYSIFIGRNNAVIVQQEWIRAEFERRYLPRKTIVAHPRRAQEEAGRNERIYNKPDRYQFFYPAYPRPFKNHELLLRAVELLEERSVSGFEVLLTVDGTQNACSAHLLKRFSKLRTVRWLGSLPREQVEQLYNETSCLVFPSKLETWGLPLSEFKATGRPIISIELPYARETIGSYPSVCFFESEDVAGLASLMEEAILGAISWETVTAEGNRDPFAKNWSVLWSMIFQESEQQDDRGCVSRRP